MKMRILKIFSLFIALIYTQPVTSQVQQVWGAKYDGFTYDDAAVSIAIDASGNVFAAGYSSNGENYDYVTVKYNSKGEQQWARRYNGIGNGDDWAYSIAVDFTGNAYVTGTSKGSGANFDCDYATIKYSGEGVEKWVARYSGKANVTDNAYQIVAGNNGAVYVTGSSQETEGDYDYTTIRYDSNGTVQWIARYDNGNGGDIAKSLAVDNTGNVYVTGYCAYNPYNFEIATVKYSPNGIQQWVRTYRGSVDNEGKSIALDRSGNVYITGVFQLDCAIGDYATIKYSNEGVLQWVRTYNGTGLSDDEANKIVVDTDGNSYVTGGSQNKNNDYDCVTIKYNTSGAQQWVQRYNSPNNGKDYAYAIALDQQGNSYVTGESNFDFVTIKYTSSGTQKWVQSYSGPSPIGSDKSYSVAVDLTGNVFVTGEIEDNETGIDFMTIKYSQSSDITTVQNKSSDCSRQVQNYPNPFNPVTTIKYSLPRASFVTLKVYDILGREITTLVNQQLNPGTHETKWDATNYSSGIYFYKLITSEFSETKRMVLIK